MSLVEAARFYTRIEADIARGALEAAGIEGVLFDAEMNWGGADLGVVPVRLMVLEEDLGAARAFLADPA